MKGLKGRFAKACTVSILTLTLMGSHVSTAYAAGEDDRTADETDWLYQDFDMINPELVGALNQNQTETSVTLEGVVSTAADETEEKGKTDRASEMLASATEDRNAETGTKKLRIAIGTFTEANKAHKEMELELTDKVVVDPSAEESVTVYEKESTDSEKVGTMRAGDGASVISETDDWYEISSGKTEGFVQKSDVLSGQAAAVAVVDGLGLTAIVNVKSINIRLEADTEAEILDVAEKSDTFKILEEGRDWTKILCADGKTEGYLSTACITVELPVLGEAVSVEEEKEAKRQAEEAAAKKAAEEEESRQAEEEARLEAERLEEERIAEESRQAEEEAEAARKAAEAEAARIAAEQEAIRIAEEEKAARKAEEQRLAEEEAARKAAAAESLAARKAEEEKAARLATEIAAVNNDDVASDGALQYVGNFRITY